MKKEITKKIYRSNDNYILTGVAGGLADYFEADPTLIRVMLVLLSLGGGSGILIYIVLSLLIPKAPGEKEEADGTKKTKEDKVNQNRFGFLGIILIGAGVIMLWNQIMPMTIRWEWIWPVVLIGLGIYIMSKK